MTIDFRTLPVTEYARQVRSKEISARELVGAAFERIAALNGDVNAFVALDEEAALREAAVVDEEIAAGRDPGLLAGVPFGVKDGEDCAGFTTTFGSKLMAGNAAAEGDSVQVDRLKAAGAIAVGKTNLPEFAWAANTTNALFGTTKNPWNLDYTVGGSSGGSAAALASGMVPLATGSDGGGSIRIPSACCALSGFKPSLGRVPTYGADGPGWLDFSTNGPMARRVADLAALLDIVVGPDSADLRSLPRPEANWRDAVVDARVPAKIGWSPDLGYAPVDAVVLERCREVLGILEGMGAEIVEVGPVFETDPVSAWLTYVSVCHLRTLDRHRDRPEWEDVDSLLRLVIDSARDVSALDMVKIFDDCHRMNRRLVEIFHDVRLLVTPATAAVPPPLAMNGLAMINGVSDPNWVRLSYPFNMTRSPAAVVSTGLVGDGIPLGIQLVGPQHGDLVVLRAAQALEEAIGFDQLAPVGS